MSHDLLQGQSRTKCFVSILSDLEWVFDEAPGRNGVHQLEHCVQTATRARRNGANDELVVCALLHDSFRLLSPANHGTAIAETLRDCLNEDNFWILQTHSAFQHDLLHKTFDTRIWTAEYWFRDAERFAFWDFNSFDPQYQSDPLESFFPEMFRVLK